MARNLKELKLFRRKLIQNKTPAELAFENAWSRIAKGKATRLKTQKIIGFYIVDFHIKKRNLIIEIDGSIHEKKEVQIHDIRKEAFFKKLGFEILRFRNEEVLEDAEKCVRQVLDTFPKTNKRGNTSKGAIIREKAAQKW